MWLLTFFLRRKDNTYMMIIFLHYPDMNEFLWCKFRCAFVCSKSKLVFLQSVKYTLASQQYSVVVNYLLCFREDNTKLRHIYRGN